MFTGDVQWDCSKSKPGRKVAVYICDGCGAKFNMPMNKHNQKQGTVNKKGFCSRSCASKNRQGCGGNDKSWIETLAWLNEQFAKQPWRESISTGRKPVRFQYKRQKKGK